MPLTDEVDRRGQGAVNAVQPKVEGARFGGDRQRASFPAEALGIYQYTIEAWVDESAVSGA